MQKVVGSNPISRFFVNALHVGGLVSARESRTNWNHPRISLIFQAFAAEELKDIEVLEVIHSKGEMARLRCRSAAGGGRIVLRLERP